VISPASERISETGRLEIDTSGYTIIGPQLEIALWSVNDPRLAVVFPGLDAASMKKQGWLYYGSVAEDETLHEETLLCRAAKPPTEAEDEEVETTGPPSRNGLHLPLKCEGAPSGETEGNLRVLRLFMEDSGSADRTRLSYQTFQLSYSPDKPPTESPISEKITKTVSCGSDADGYSIEGHGLTIHLSPLSHPRFRELMGANAPDYIGMGWIYFGSAARTGQFEEPFILCRDARDKPVRTKSLTRIEIRD